MAERKETPDVLGEILGNLTPPAEPVPPTSASPSVLPAPKRSRPAPKPKTVAAPPPEPEVQAALPPLFGLRTQWEYLHVVFRDYDGWRPYQQEGAKIANWKQGPDIDSYLAHLGEQGWELAGAANGEHGQLDAFFKRIKR